jgi:hypothetical protein
LFCLGYADFGESWSVEELVGAFNGTFVAGEVAHDERHGVELVEGGAAVAAGTFEFSLAAFGGKEHFLQVVSAELGAQVALDHLFDELVLFGSVGMVGGGHGLLDFLGWVAALGFLGEEERG